MRRIYCYGRPAYGIAPDGSIVGRFRDVLGVTHGYLLKGGQYTVVDINNATFTGAASTNVNGDIVGRYVASGVTHGFLMSQPPPHYTLTDLGTLPGEGFSMANFTGDDGTASAPAIRPDGRVVSPG